MAGVLKAKVLGSICKSLFRLIHESVFVQETWVRVNQHNVTNKLGC